MKHCVHSRLYTPLLIVWGAVEVPLGIERVLAHWESGAPEPWARAVLRLPDGYAWASEEILWHAGEKPRRIGRKRALWTVVISRAVYRVPGVEVT